MNVPAVARFTTLVAVVLASASLALAGTLHTGSWTKKTAKASGEWTIIEEDGGRFIELSDSFKTKNAPDLALYVSPLSVGELKNKNAEQGAVKIAQLTSHKGAQRYELPADLDLAEFTSVMIHCKKYTKLWCASAL